MTPAGWIFMLLSVGFVTALTAFCFYKVLARPASAEHLNAPQTIDTQDLNG